MATLTVDKDECTACNLCSDELPAVFGADEEGLAFVKDQNGASEDEIQEQIDNCPAECIKWE